MDSSLSHEFPAEIAFSGSYRARLGRDHDGFHYDGKDNVGTYRVHGFHFPAAGRVCSQNQ